MKVLLATIDSKYIHSNAAVYSIKAYVEKGFREHDRACDLSISEYTINQQTEKVLADIYKQVPDVIMFSCYIWNVSFMGRVLDDLATVTPDLKIWLGGPEVSFDAEEVLMRFKNIRGVMLGEGEETVKDVLDAYINDTQFSEVKGIVYRECAGNIVRTPCRTVLDMDELPFAYEDLSGFENRVIYYESSRGCPFRCSYCLSSVDKQLRFRGMDIVKKELKFFLDKRVPQLKFVDRTFNCDHERTKEIWQFLKDNDNGVTNFHFEVAADILTVDEIELLGSLRPGQVQLEIGVQTTNSETLAAIERPMNFDKVSENVRRIKNFNNVHVHLDLIAGLPYEDLDSFKKSFNDVFSLRPEQLQLGFLKVLKGSPIATRCEEYELNFTKAPPYEVLKNRWISYEELLELKQVEEMVEVYYNSGQFAASIELLINASENAYEMFNMLGQFYEDSGLNMMNLSRNSRYARLLDFSRSLIERRGGDDLDEATFRNALIFDYYSRENVKNRPKFLGEETVGKEFEKEFYSNESREHRYLTSPELIECNDPRTLRKHTHIEHITGRYLVFDYTRREPLTNNASVVEITQLGD